MRCKRFTAVLLSAVLTAAGAMIVGRFYLACANLLAGSMQRSSMAGFEPHFRQVLRGGKVWR